MYKFSNTSLKRMEKTHPDLRKVVLKAMSYQIIDFSVIEGVRTKDKQAAYVKAGVSKTMNSKHLLQADGYSHAVDLYPYPIDMKRVNRGDSTEIARFGVLAGIVAVAAKELGVSIRQGWDWDGDGEALDHSFLDWPHVELL